MVAAFGLKRRWIGARRFILPWECRCMSARPERYWRGQGVEILLVEDNPDDEELTLITLEQNNIANLVKVIHDGAEALDYLFGTGDYHRPDAAHYPHLILLDLKLPKISGIEVLE